MATHAHGRTAADAAPRPLHNAALLTAASRAAKGCGFVLLLVAARVPGKDGFGEYSQVEELHDLGRGKPVMESRVIGYAL